LDRLIQRSITQKKPLNVKEAQARIQSQTPLSEKVKYAHFVIDNSGGMAELKTTVVELWEDLKNCGKNRSESKNDRKKT
jgi:dephospho-CoA kinase